MYFPLMLPAGLVSGWMADKWGPEKVLPPAIILSIPFSLLWLLNKHLDGFVASLALWSKPLTLELNILLETQADLYNDTFSYFQRLGSCS